MVQILRQKTIILVSFPFSNQVGEKKRPALIVSNDNFNETSDDVLACAITSNGKHEHSLEIKKEDWKDGLYSESYVNYSSLFALDKKIILKPIGRLSSERFTDVKKKILEII